MELDLSQIDSSTLLGQLAILIVVLSGLFTAIKPLVSGVPKSIKYRNYRSLANDLRETKFELDYQRGLNRSMREWELMARETLREMQNDLVSAGVPENPRIGRLLELLEDNEKSRGEFVEKELNREPEQSGKLD